MGYCKLAVLHACMYVCNGNRCSCEYYARDFNYNVWYACASTLSVAGEYCSVANVLTLCGKSILHCYKLILHGTIWWQIYDCFSHGKHSPVYSLSIVLHSELSSWFTSLCYVALQLTQLVSPRETTMTMKIHKKKSMVYQDSREVVSHEAKKGQSDHQKQNAW